MKMKDTKDIYLAAIFLAMGAKYEKVDKTDQRHQVFYFSTDEDQVATPGSQIVVTRGVDFEMIEQQYANEELLINAVKFKQALQRMKSIVHSS